MFLFFKPPARTEVRVSCPDCNMINEEEIDFFSTDKKIRHLITCKRCLKKFTLEIQLTCTSEVIIEKNVG